MHDILVSDFVDLLDKVKTNPLGTFIESPDGIFESLLVCPVVRFGITFTTIRNVRLKQQYQGLGLFKDFAKSLPTSLDIMFFDIINPNLLKWLKTDNYQYHTEFKYGENIDIMFRLSTK